jgi:hypothetical protein
LACILLFDVSLAGDVMGSALLAPQPTHFSEKKKPDDCDLKQIVVSPTTCYAACDVFAPKHE